MELHSHTSSTNDLALIERGQRFITKEYPFRVHPDPTGRSGYRLVAGNEHFYVCVDVPVLKEDERNRAMASRTLENAVDGLAYRAGEACSSLNEGD